MGRDLVVALTTEGFEESVVLSDAKSQPSYLEEFTVPKGVTARNAEDGIEFLDPEGKVILAYGRGLAHDASWPAAGPDASSPVSVRLAEAAPAVVVPTVVPTTAPAIDADSPTTTSTTIEVPAGPTSSLPSATTSPSPARPTSTC